MKNNIFLLSFFLLLGLSAYLVGCRQSDVPVAALRDVTDTKAMRAFLVSDLGLDDARIVETEDGFIYEGDIAFPKKDFWEMYGKPEQANAKHYRTTYTVGASYRNILVSFDPNKMPPAAWLTAYRTAMTKWNNLNRTVKFTECQCSPANGIIVRYQSLGSSANLTFAETYAPLSSGKPGTYSTINSTCTVTLSAAEKLYTAVHELGHAVGLGHTDAPISGANTLITTASTTCNAGTDPYSVMKQGQISYVGFSTCDVKAIQTLY